MKPKHKLHALEFIPAKSEFVLAKGLSIPANNLLKYFLQDLHISGIKFEVYKQTKKETIMKKKVELKKLKLNKEKIATLTTSQTEAIKGGKSVLEPIKNTSFAADAGCTGR